MKKKKVKIFLSVVILVGAISYIIFSSMGQGSVYYYKVGEIKNLSSNQLKKRSRVAGKLDKKSVKYDENKGKLTLTIYEGKEKIKIYYDGTIPDTLFKGEELIAEGNFKDKKIFLADNIITKCPSKYEAKGKEHPSSLKK